MTCGPSLRWRCPRSGKYGSVVSQNVDFDVNGTPLEVGLLLPSRGDWRVDFTDLKRGGALDSGWFCLADDRAAFHLAGVSWLPWRFGQFA